MKFKIGQMVKYETPTGEIHFARVEAEIAPRRYRILVTPDAFRLEVPAGDIALPGEDADNAARADNAAAWRKARVEGGWSRTDGQGNYASVALDPLVQEEGSPGPHGR